jgi:hypothetical protein
MEALPCGASWEAQDDLLRAASIEKIRVGGLRIRCWVLFFPGDTAPREKVMGATPPMPRQQMKETKSTTVRQEGHAINSSRAVAVSSEWD